MDTKKTDDATAIVRSLETVTAERDARQRDAELAAKVDALKHYQQERFRRSYTDLLNDGRHRNAARFFLEELYGPKDFEQRDAQFMRIVPALKRMFPQEIVHTVSKLAALHALSEELDTEMGRKLGNETITAAGYVQAWQATARPEVREQQITLTLAVGEALDRYTRLPMLGTTLRMMRGPAKAAGMGELQHFLETGFDTFKAMRGAQQFLDCIALRERALCAALFDAQAVTQATGKNLGDANPLGQLP